MAACRLLQRVQAALEPSAADLTAIRQSISSLLELRQLLTARPDGGRPRGAERRSWLQR